MECNLHDEDVQLLSRIELSGWMEIKRDEYAGNRNGSLLTAKFIRKREELSGIRIVINKMKIMGGR
jgi:hypothetical protein